MYFSTSKLHKIVLGRMITLARHGVQRANTAYACPTQKYLSAQLQQQQQHPSFWHCWIAWALYSFSLWALFLVLPTRIQALPLYTSSAESPGVITIPLTRLVPNAKGSSSPNVHSTSFLPYSPSSFSSSLVKKRATGAVVPVATLGTVGYAGHILIGNPPQRIAVLFDTGSDLALVISDACQGVECPELRQFSCSNSVTCVDLGSGRDGGDDSNHRVGVNQTDHGTNSLDSSVMGDERAGIGSARTKVRDHERENLDHEEGMNNDKVTPQRKETTVHIEQESGDDGDVNYTKPTTTDIRSPNMIPYPVIPVAHLVEPDGVGKINFQRLKGTDSRRKYRPKASSSSGTFPPRQKLYNQTYVDGSWGAGTFVQDRIQIDSAPTGSSKPALASTPAVLQLNSASSSTAAPSATVTFLNVIKDNLGLVRGYEGQISGLLGLTRASATGRKTFLQELVQQGSLAQPVMSMHLGLDGGSFMIGGIDSTQYLGELVYSPVTDPITWRISLQGLGTLSRPTTCMGETTTTVYESVQQQETSNNTIGNDNLMKPLPQRNLFHDAPLIIDSGTSSILIPTAASQVIHGELFGTYDPVHKVWFLPCEGPDLVWWISSGQYGIVQPYESLIYALEDGRCQSLIFDNHLADYWILGDSWLRGLYLVYDMAGSGRIGIAEAIHSDAETSSEPTSSGPGLRTRILVYQSTSGGRPSFGANWTWSAVSSVACVLLIQAVGWSVYFP